MSYAIRIDGQGWRAIDSESDLLPGEVLSETQPLQSAPTESQLAAAEIVRLEAASMMPRVVREYLLADLKDKAVKAGLNLMLLPAYVKVKALDDQIAALRAKL